MVKFSKATCTIISILTASALASQDCQCYVEFILGVQDDAASTKACCDQWENAHASGVKYSGTWDDLCEDPNGVISTSSWNDCCVDQDVFFGVCG